MKKDFKCLRCGSTNIHKGHQEMFPSTFMPDSGSRLSVLRSLLKSKEFDLYACFDCGHAEWFIRDKYISNKKAKIEE